MIVPDRTRPYITVHNRIETVHDLTRPYITVHDRIETVHDLTRPYTNIHDGTTGFKLISVKENNGVYLSFK
jgi:hypothetical protein